MDILLFIITWISGFVTLVVADTIWLGYIMRGVIKSDFKDYVAFKKDGSVQIRLGIGLLAWAIISFGVVFFVTLQQSNIINSFLYGGLFGFILYACYDLTNYTFFKNYSTRFLIIDIVWGSIVGSLIAGISYLVKSSLGGVL